MREISHSTVQTCMYIYIYVHISASDFQFSASAFLLFSATSPRIDPPDDVPRRCWRRGCCAPAPGIGVSSRRSAPRSRENGLGNGKGAPVFGKETIGWMLVVCFFFFFVFVSFGWLEAVGPSKGSKPIF